MLVGGGPRPETKRFLWMVLGIAAVALICWGMQIYFAFWGETTIQSNHEQYIPSQQQQRTMNYAITSVSNNTSSSLVVSLLRPQDYEQFTVRLQTWQRSEALPNLLHNLLLCDRVAQVQIIWCMAQGPVPEWLIQRLEQQDQRQQPPKIVLERHWHDSSLNARFHILQAPPTRGVLSQDDDLIRPCLALNSGFDLWTINPERMVGYYARSHSVKRSKDGHEIWYADNKATSVAFSNQYSFTLTKFSFLHVDYLHSYTNNMPDEIRSHIVNVTNCEDIAMSFWVSSLTQGQPPLLADKWAVDTTVQVESFASDSRQGISRSTTHHDIRSDCINRFANILHLKEQPHRLEPAERVHCKSRIKRKGHFEVTYHTGTIHNGKYFQFGLPGRNVTSSNTPMAVAATRLQQHRQLWSTWSDSKIAKHTRAMRMNLTSQFCKARTTPQGKIACLV